MARLSDGRTSVDVSANKTLTAADQGIVQRVVADGVTITLPSTAPGLVFVVMNNGAAPANGTPGSVWDGSAGVTVAPQAADGITGLGFTAAAGKGAVNTKATAIVGDEIRLEASGVAGAGAWNVAVAKGIWARQA